jgi:hypothetical protein
VAAPHSLSATGGPDRQVPLPRPRAMCVAKKNLKKAHKPKKETKQL